MPAAITYVLGKDCVLEIDDEEIKGVSDVSVRESVTEIDATGWGNFGGQSTVVVGRAYEINFSVPDVAAARKLFEKRRVRTDGVLVFFYVPQLIRVRLTGGVWDIDELFSIHSIDGDQPLNDAVIARFELRQWCNVAGESGESEEAS
jgi:hypothetical protein